MPFPRPHLLLSPIGDAYSATEEWTFTLRVDRSAMPSEVEHQAALDAYSAWMTAAGNAVSSYHRLLGLKVAPIGTNGLYPPGEVSKELLLATAVSGLTTGSGVIPQQTCVVSLLTDLARGRGNRGRIYPPPQAAGVTVTGGIAPSNQQTFADNAAALINSVQTALGAPVCVGSELANTLRPVTRVEVGRVIDTQRRRRGAISEDYLGTPVNPQAGA